MSTIVLQAPIRTTVSRVLQLSKKYTKEDAEAEARVFRRAFIVRYGNAGKRVALDLQDVIKTEVGYVARFVAYWDTTSAIWDFPILRITDTTTDPPTTTLGIWDHIHHLIVFYDMEKERRVEYKLPEHIVGKVQSGAAIKFCFKTQRIWVDGEKVDEESIRLPEFQKEK